MAIDKANSERIAPRMPKQSSPAVPFLKVQRSPTKKRRITYNVQAIQSLSGVKGNTQRIVKNAGSPAYGLAAGFIGFNAANTQRLANEALAAQYGLRAVYNAPQVGESVVRTTQGFQYGGPFGEIFRRAGRNAANMNVSYIDDATYAAGRASAIADEVITRGQSVTDAYQYVRLPAERFSAFKPVTNTLRNVWKGISQAGQSTLGASLLPAGAMRQEFENFIFKNMGWDINTPSSLDV